MKISFKHVPSSLVSEWPLLCFVPVIAYYCEVPENSDAKSSYIYIFIYIYQLRLGLTRHRRYGKKYEINATKSLTAVISDKKETRPWPICPNAYLFSRNNTFVELKSVEVEIISTRISHKLTYYAKLSSEHNHKQRE